MYSESDIDGAVQAGALTPEAAAAFRRHVAGAHAAPAVDEEHFRLLTGFNDIFVSIAIVLLFVALGQIGAKITAAFGGLLIAGAAWGLAESGSVGGSTHPSSAPAGRSCAAVVGPGGFEFVKVTETGSDDRIANMQDFTRAALQTLEHALSR